jgi:tripartite-type tricarboxylate transporter receptor subunit TctC
MDSNALKQLATGLVVSLGSGLACCAWAQSFPAKPIKLVAPYAPGGPTDIMARVIAKKVSETIGEQMVVENRPGAGGIVGAEAVAKSPADGYTLLLASGSTIAMAPFLYTKLAYAPSDFAPIGLFSEAPFMVVVHPSVGANTLKEFIALAKSKPGTLSYGSAGVGNILHVSGEWFKAMTGTDLVHIPYKGGAPARLDLVTGRIQAMFEMYATFQADIPAGKVKVLAVASAKKHPLLPNVPTAAEAGLPGYESSAWFGLVAPKGSPNEAVTRLNAEMQKALATKEVKDMLASLAFEPRGGSPERFAAFIQGEINKWGKVIKSAGITAE